MPFGPARHLTPSSWRRAAPRYVAVLVALDFSVALVVATVMSNGTYGLGEAFGVGLLAATGFVVAVAVCHGYRPTRLAVSTDELRTVIHVTGLLGVASLALEGLGLLHLPHTLVLQALALTIGLATLTRLAQRGVMRHLRAGGHLARRTLLVGPMDSLRLVFDALTDSSVHGLTVVGVCTPDASVAAPPGPVVGTYDTVPQQVVDLGAEAVVVSADAMDAPALRRLGWQLRDLPVDLLVLPPLTDVLPRRLHLQPMAGTPLLSVSVTESRIQRSAKWLFDRAVGAVLLALTSPVIAVAGLAVRLTSRGPAFFSQTRIGMGGRPFTMYKLRSMYIDAESRLAELRSHNDGNGLLFKMHEDPRVTRVGRTLRRLSIDELPQLWNVVKGDMSLVGPRPALPSEVATYSGDMCQRLQVRPGLTGLWQVSGRSNLSMERSVQLDLRYADNWSVGMDLQILLRTARAVVRGDGAY